MNSLKELNEYGQSVWIDYIERSLITSGALQRMVEEDGLRGVTSNPSIFEKAITGGAGYEDAIKGMAREKEASPMALYEGIAIHDIRGAADVLRPVYEKTNGRDGYVSLEVSPYIAHDTDETIKEAKRLWQAVGRENLMIKVPATPEGIPAVEELISLGINVNVTLLFSLQAYESSAQAYIAGLEKFTASGGEPGKIASVASFFVSRIDTAVDALVSDKLETSASGEDGETLKNIMGKVAIANAKLAYQKYKEIFKGDRWQALVDKGAETQRVLWASTSVKNPKYNDLLYIEELIGPDTVNTIPPATYDAFRDHGKPTASLEANADTARETMERLEKSGVSMDEVTDALLKDGVGQFASAFDRLLNAVEEKQKASLKQDTDRQASSLPGCC